MRRLLASCIALAALASPVMAGVISPSGVMSLTPTEREAAIDSASAADPLGGAAPARGVHGEVGFEVGSRGERAAFGTAVMPLGSNGMLALSFMNAQSGRWYRR